ncbi:hypothetical protein M0G43_11435 [Subsaxibacter sp. CAU 1640]|uniref:hypothetical protein n=1 Tax=Subsaxibacter sp. CAU 1640 TaxID=2933271 RepID=UPI002005DA7C|nr:hypothetical protein [Subsaxibacter sp. CAU 1640]MCK7591189.1 hypothetical protein [Subsaxibacter sp. CAU 1640]
MNPDKLFLLKAKYLIGAFTFLTASIVYSQRPINISSEATKVDNATFLRVINDVLLNPSDFSFENNPSEISTFKTAKKWIQYKNELGAFSVKLPEEPKDISREMPNPLDEEGDPYKVHMLSSVDEKNNCFYLVRYNDMPNGYYMSDREAGFSSIQENLQGKAILVSEPKEIYLDSVEGREVELLISGSYHAILKIYIRGNRVYVLMAQKLNTSDKVDQKREFFKSFRLDPYSNIKLTTFKPESNKFEVGLFGDVKTTVDSVGYESTRVKQSINHYSINPTSGGLYQLNEGELQEYVQIKDLSEFYKEHFELYKDWNDSIISQKDVKVNGTDGMEFLLENGYSKIKERHQIWLDNNHLFVMTGYLSDEERNSTIANAAFNSFKYNASNGAKFDRMSSKADLLFKDLHAEDSIRRHRAYGAFDYYKFEQADLPKLYNALNETYTDTTYASAIKEVIIGEFANVHDAQTVENLKSMYLTTFKNEEEIKGAILVTLPTIEENGALETYKELLVQSPPTKSENYMWQLLQPFRDSTAFTIDNIKVLTDLMKHEEHRYYVMNIATNLITEHPDKKDVVLDNKEKFLKHVKEDLESYTKSLKDSIENYEYYGVIYSYLSFFNESRLDTPISDEFTSKIISDSNLSWHRSLAMTSRIYSNQSLDPILVNSFMDSLNYRFELMKAYKTVGKFEKVPEKYKQNKAFAELSLYTYYTEDDYGYESIDFLGEITKNDDVYYAYKVKYEEDEETVTSYIATVGPIKDVMSMESLENYDVHTDWEQLDIIKWKSQAEALIPDVSEED